MIRRRPSAEPPYFPFPPVRNPVFAELAAGQKPSKKIVAVTAPTGYGKTVLLAGLYREYRKGGTDCRWLALDDRDGTVERLLGLLEAALIDPGSEVNVAEAIHEGDVPVVERIDNLLDALRRLPAPATVFIDNLGYCVDESLGILLDALIFQTPATIRFLVSSTTSLPFNQARATLEGLLRTVGLQELGLGGGEIRQLLGPDLSGRLPDAALAQITRQTEGWPAAIRLVQIVLSASGDPAAAVRHFSGADADLAALLNRQVLQGLDTGARKFLLEVSLLRSFGINLCRYATGDQSAAAYVNSLLAKNLFVIPLDRNRSWYRLHGLFREFLLDEAGRELTPGRRGEVLARAAEWCEHEALWEDAVEYALASGSSALAAGILDRVAAMFVRDRGDLRQYIEWVEKLHATGASCGFEADFWYMWALVFHRRYESARKHLKRLTRRLEKEGDEAPPEEISALRRRLEIIGIIIDTYTDQMGEAHARAQEWLPGQPGDDPFNVATVATASGVYLTSSFEPVAAREVMRVAQSSISQAQTEYGAGWVALVTCSASLHEGDYLVAHQNLLAALERCKAALGETAGISCTIALLAAKSAIELCSEAEARELLALGLRKFQTHGIVDTAAFGLDAAVKLWCDEPGDLASMAQLEEFAAAYPPRLSLMLSCFLIRRLLRLGRMEEAVIEAGRVGLTDGTRGSRRIAGVQATAYSDDLMMAAEIELDIAAGRLKPAAAKVAEETRKARAIGRWGRLVELALDEAAISQCSHNPAPALRHLARAVSIAARRRYLRPFRDRAEMVAGLVNETKPKDWGFVLDEERRFFADICRGLPLANSPLVQQLEELNVVSALADSPTARELELLTLVDAGLSNQQLADKLSVSVATVKWHLYNLYTKLGVSSRSAALSRARALNLLNR